MYQDESVEAKRRILVKLNFMKNKEVDRLRMIMEEGVEAQLRAQKEKHIKQKMQQLREEQKEDLDQKS